MSKSPTSFREGNLEAPTRHALDWQSPEFYDEKPLMEELERVYDICHGCRRCVSLCDAFPTLFDLVDKSDTFEVDGVAKTDYWKVVDECYLCDLCYQVKCPYVPPHEWNVDFPQLVKLIDEGWDMVAAIPSCVLMFKQELPLMFPDDEDVLKVKKHIFEADSIEDELNTYNPLIPNGTNLKATAMLEYQDVEERKQQLALLRGIEDLIWIQVEGFDPVYAISNEDLERSNDEKTSAVHFMRFELKAEMISALQDGVGLMMGTSHEYYPPLSNRQ